MIIKRYKIYVKLYINQNFPIKNHMCISNLKGGSEYGPDSLTTDYATSVKPPGFYAPYPQL